MSSKLKENFMYRLFGLLFAILHRILLRLRILNSPAAKDKHSGFVIVRLDRTLVPFDNQHQSLIDVCDAANLEKIRAVLTKYALEEKTLRLIQGIEPEILIRLETEARDSSFAPLNSLTAYWRVDSRKHGNHIHKIVSEFQSAFGVDLSYAERTAQLASNTLTSEPNPYAKFQGYLNSAEEGIDARWAWTLSGGEGNEVQFVDIELAWNLKHEDYSTRALSSASLLHGDINCKTRYVEHGTNTLGVVLADDNFLGIKGIAPRLKQAKLSSSYDSSTNTNGHIASAIVSAIYGIDAGDVILIELQRFGLPVETDAADFDAIRLAVAHERVVVEAAGNKGVNLGSYVDPTRGYILNPDKADYQGDSGATMVGAAESAVTNGGHRKIHSSNSGSRVNCYAWGQNVVSCGGEGNLSNGGGDPNKEYTKSYGGTSSASSIIAGAAILLQGVHRRNEGTSLSNLQIRSLLSDSTTGTKQTGNLSHPIGVMPNLRAIFDKPVFKDPSRESNQANYEAEL